jgi:hypothetical protein
MLTFYMIFWSTIIIIALGMWRLRNWGQVVIIALVSAFVLLVSQSLFIQLSLTAALEPESVFSTPDAFLRSGPFGWLALLVMPCGWLGPFIGFNLVKRQDEALD